MEQEEAGEPELADQRQLLVEPCARLALVAVGAAVARVERAVADRRQLGDRGLVAVGEVRVAVAELLREVELEPLGELGGARDGVGSSGKRSAIASGGSRTRLVVAAALALAPSSDVRLRIATSASWSERAPAVVRVDVAGRDRLDAERLRELAAARALRLRVAALVRPLELDEEPVLAEDRRQLAPRRSVRVPRDRRRAQPDRQTSPSLSSANRCRSSEGGSRLRRLGPSPGMRRGEQPAEIRVPARRLDEQRHVRPVRERHLRAGDRAHAERLRRVRELERAVDAVVVGQRERLVAELGGPRGELLRLDAPSRNEYAEWQCSSTKATRSS